EGFLIVETDLACDDPALPLSKEDIRLQGRCVSDSAIGGPEALARLDVGEFLLETEDGTWELVEGPYEDFVINPDPAIGAQAHAFLTALETAAARYPRQTHMQRLEMVAHVAGYRSWHAAQAHLSKQS
ncbi:MAG: hypothetical protein ABJJ38_06795, partial [Roseibium sp.]